MWQLGNVAANHDDLVLGRVVDVVDVDVVDVVDAGQTHTGDADM